MKHFATLTVRNCDRQKDPTYRGYTYDDFDAEIYFEDGIVRYVSNNSVPPDDVVKHWVSTNQISIDVMRKSLNAKSEELTKFLQARQEWLMTQEGQECQREMDMMARYA